MEGRRGRKERKGDEWDEGCRGRWKNRRDGRGYLEGMEDLKRKRRIGNESRIEQKKRKSIV